MNPLLSYHIILIILSHKTTKYNLFYEKIEEYAGCMHVATRFCGRTQNSVDETNGVPKLYKGTARGDICFKRKA